MTKIKRAELNSTIAQSIDFDRFQLRPEHGWVWLQKLAIWTLKKIGCFAKVSVTRMEVKVPELEKVLKSIIEESGSAKMLNQKGLIVLMGPNQWGEFCSEIFGSPTTISHSMVGCGDSGFRTVFGMEITLIPWMDGSLVVPKDYVQ